MIIIFGRNPKTYEMLSGSNCTLDSLKAVAEIEHMGLHLKRVDVTVKVGEPPVEYKLEHHYSSILGGKIEFRTSDEKFLNDVIAAVEDSIDGKSEQFRSGGKVIVTVNPKPKPGVDTKLSLIGLLDAASSYAEKGLREPTVTGYKIENLPQNLYKEVVNAKVPLQEVRT